VERVLLEIPAGNVEDKEEPLECAKRELEEETGFSAGKWEKLGYFYTSPGFCTEDMYLYLATELKEAKRKADDDEYIKLEKIPLDRIRGIIDSGEICDAKSIAGLLLVLRSMGV
jgi:ADP-ribose pyrophosphatase